jgi:2-keto-3-deoxy-L-rhamnonate aldolase RhmA
MEHSPISIETIGDMSQVTRALGFPIVVRPPEGNREWITRLLDSGVWNLQVPQIDTPEQAEAVVRAARYAPLGMRGMAGNVAPHADFEPGPAGSVNAIENEDIHITAMLESREAFSNIDEIASVTGIDALTLGPSDLAQDLGVLGTPEQSAVLEEYTERMFDAAKRHGVHISARADSVDLAKKRLAQGADLITYSSDAVVLQSAYMGFLTEVRGG